MMMLILQHLQNLHVNIGPNGFYVWFESTRAVLGVGEEFHRPLIYGGWDVNHQWVLRG